MLKRSRIVILVLFPFFLHAVSPLPGAEDWPRWRGPLDNGSAQAGAFPVKWSGTDNIAWKVQLPGNGCSTPIVWGDHIIVTSPAGGKDAVVDFDRSGKKRWQVEFGKERSGKHRMASGSNPSPITDGECIFVYYKSGTLAALDFEGRVLWKTNLQERFGEDTLWWDIGTSPVLTVKHVVVAVMHENDSFLAAFEKKTGEVGWKVARNYDCAREGSQSYTTPLVVGDEGDQKIVVFGAEHLTAHDAADGILLWSCGGFNPKGRKNWTTVASPVIAGNVAVVPYGRGSRLVGIKLGGEGDVTLTHRLWTLEDSGSFVPTPAEHGGKVYVLDDQGMIRCFAPEAGKLLESIQLPRNRAKYYASPVVADGKIYAARDDGVVFVIRARAPFEVLSENAMGERMIASPVPVAGCLFLRGEHHLFCVKATN